MKKRADLLLIENKIVQSRNKAQAMIMAGQIYINGKKVLKSGELFDINSKIIYKSLHPQWVSRGALKLLKAIEFFNIDIEAYALGLPVISSTTIPLITPALFSLEVSL